MSAAEEPPLPQPVIDLLEEGRLFGQDSNGNWVAVSVDGNGDLQVSIDNEDVGIEGDDDDGNTLQVAAETLSEAISDPDGLVTYSDRALEQYGNDEFRVSLYAEDDAGNLNEIQAEELDTTIGGTETALITTVANALNDVAQDELVVRVTGADGTQVADETLASTGLAGTTDALLTHVSAALNDVGQDELVARVTGADGTQVQEVALGTALGGAEPSLVTKVVDAFESQGNESLQTTGTPRDEFTDGATNVELDSGSGGGTQTFQFDVTENMDVVRVAVDDAEGSFHVEVRFQDGAGNNRVVRDNNNSAQFSGDSTTDVFVSVEIAAPQVEVAVVDDSGASNTVDINVRAN